MGSSRSKIFKDQTSDLPPSEKSVVLLSSVCPNHLPTLWERCDRAIVFQKFLLADFKLTRSRPTHSEQSESTYCRRLRTKHAFNECVRQVSTCCTGRLVTAQDEEKTCHASVGNQADTRASQPPGTGKKSVASNRNGRRKIPNNLLAQTWK